MSGNPKITEDQIISDSSVLLSLVDTNASKAHKKRLLKAAAFEKLESVVDTVAETAGGKVASKAPKAQAAKPAQAAGSVDDSYETFSGKNLYINNGISVEAMLEMLKNDTKAANEAYKLYGSTAMLKAGFSKDETTGLITHSSDAIVTQEGTQIINSGASQAASLRLDGIKGAVDGFGQLGSELLGHLATRKDTQEEEANVNKLQFALDAEKEIPQGHIHATDANGGALDENGAALRNGPTSDVKRAIAALESNGYDVTKGDNNFGSYMNKKTSVVSKSPAYEGDDINVGNDVKVPVREALANATVQQRASIRKNLQNRLNKAEDRLNDANKASLTKRNRISQQGAQFTAAATSVVGLSKATNSLATAQAEAEKVVIKNMSDTETGLMQKQGEGISAATKNQSTALDLLRQMYAQLGKRG